MDYEKLRVILPKEPVKWTTEDVSLWLKFIGLESLYQNFKMASVDGSVLSCLTEEDLKTQLEIKSNIMVKKLMTWIKVGMKEYQAYLLKSSLEMGTIHRENQQDLTAVGNMTKNNAQNSNKSKKPQKMQTMKMQQQKIPYPLVAQVQTLEKRESAQENKQQKIQLILQQVDGPQTSYYSLKQEGGKIGRHSSNQILILEESISRYHAEIIFQNSHFYIKDVGSTTGTFTKITEKLLIEEGMIIEMGSNQFMVDRLEDNTAKFVIIEGPNINQEIEVTINKGKKINFGRKVTNQIHFPQDQHLSNIHATFFMIDNKYFLEDLATTNGSWRRLSAEMQQSEAFPLSNGTVFKIGANLTYICKINSAVIEQEKTTTNVCVICYESDKDCVYIPCKHNAACIRCSKNLKECPICRTKIQDFIKIYKS